MDSSKRKRFGNRKNLMLYAAAFVLISITLLTSTIKLLDVVSYANTLRTIRTANSELDIKTENLTIELEMAMRTEVLEMQAQNRLGMIMPPETDTRVIDLMPKTDAPVKTEHAYIP